MDTDDFPAFYCRKSGFRVDYNAKDANEIARIIKTNGMWAWRAARS